MLAPLHHAVLRVISLVYLMGQVGCKAEAPTPAPEPELPAMRTPASHAAPVVSPPPMDEWRPRVRLPEPERSHRPSTTGLIAPPTGPAPEVRNALLPTAREAPKPKPKPESESESKSKSKSKSQSEAEPETESAEQEGIRWAMQASLLEPGCLLSDHVPALPLPSPEALAWTLSKQPEPFAGVAREALTCRLQLPRLTRAEVFGANAFRRMALSRRATYAGGDRTLGLVAAAIVTDNPAGEGTLLLLMEERTEAWEIRASAWVPFEGDARTRRLVRLRETRLVSRNRPTIVFRERDRGRTSDHYLSLSDTQELRRVLRLPVAGRTPKLVARARPRGGSWPRRMEWRATETPKEGSARWMIQTWEAEPEQPYARTADRQGSIDLGGASDLLETGHPKDAKWVHSKLPRKIRRSGLGLLLRARIAAAQGKHRQSMRLWRKALRTKKALPSWQRDYGLYLASQKRRKKEAIKALKAYLKAEAQAEDAPEIRSRLEQLSGAGR